MIDFGRLYIVAGRVLSLVPVRIGVVLSGTFSFELLLYKSSFEENC